MRFWLTPDRCVSLVWKGRSSRQESEQAGCSNRVAAPERQPARTGCSTCSSIGPRYGSCSLLLASAGSVYHYTSGAPGVGTARVSQAQETRPHVRLRRNRTRLDAVAKSSRLRMSDLQRTATQNIKRHDWSLKQCTGRRLSRPKQQKLKARCK